MSLKGTVTPCPEKLQPVADRLLKMIDDSCDVWASKTYVRLQLLHSHSLVYDSKVSEALATLQKVAPEHVRLCFHAPRGQYKNADVVIAELALIREELCTL